LILSKNNKIKRDLINQKHTRNCIGRSSISISAIVIADGGFVLVVDDSSIVT
jgi:hypothetical protein